jgi:hypothetical protein
VDIEVADSIVLLNDEVDIVVNVANEVEDTSSIQPYWQLLLLRQLFE